VTNIGLRIDVDTYRGTRDGVPRLLELLAQHGVTATFFFTVGPDNMGRHIQRLLRPSFLIKMLRSNATSLYGWDIVFAGTLWPGRRIAKNLGNVFRAADQAGHEVGLHAWDHHRWQTRAGRMTTQELHDELQLGIQALSDVIGRKPDSSAAAGWICNERALEAKDQLGFAYNSDCRGRSVFRPTVQGRTLAPQVPTTMPTYDEIIGRDGVNRDNYNARLLKHAQPDQLNVLAVHAEVEGIVCAPLFNEFLSTCQQQGIRLMPLRALPQLQESLPEDTVTQAPIFGREGDVCWQSSAVGQ
jgi:undecaprenyl phosphate-alpha-L-ara4FN deformylase